MGSEEEDLSTAGANESPRLRFDWSVTYMKLPTWLLLIALFKLGAPAFAAELDPLKVGLFPVGVST